MEIGLMFWDMAPVSTALHTFIGSLRDPVPCLTLTALFHARLNTTETSVTITRIQGVTYHKTVMFIVSALADLTVFLYVSSYMYEAVTTFELNPIVFMC
jgi:hypothetical protein